MYETGKITGYNLTNTPPPMYVAFFSLPLPKHRGIMYSRSTSTGIGVFLMVLDAHMIPKFDRDDTHETHIQ